MLRISNANNGFTEVPIKTITLTIKDLAPVLINRFKESDEITKAIDKNGKKDYGTPREQAELTPYADEPRTSKSLLWVPSTWIMGSIATIASDYKIPGSRKSIKSVYGGAIIPREEKIYFTEKYTLKDIEVDSRPVVIQRARIMRHRARIEHWTLSLTLELDETIIPVDSLHQLISDAGRRAGIGDFRANKGGPFGRYKVTRWTVANERGKKKDADE